MADSIESTDARTQRILLSADFRLLAVGEVQLLGQPIDKLDLVELSDIADSMGEADVRMLPILDCATEYTAEALHGKGPVAPYRASVPDVVRDVEESVHG